MSWTDSDIPTELLTTRTLSPTMQVAAVLGGIAIPVCGHVLSFFRDGSGGTNWQTGLLSDQLSFVLSGQVGFVFYPLTLYSMICLAKLVQHESELAHRFTIRFGIYSGVPVAAWYSAVTGANLLGVENLLSSRWLFVLALWLVTGLLPGLYWASSSMLLRWVDQARALDGRGAALAFVSVMLVGGTLICGGALLSHSVLVPLCGSFLSLWVYLGLSMYLGICHRQPRQYRLSHALAVIAWLAAFLGACRFAVMQSLAEYARLPR